MGEKLYLFKNSVWEESCRIPFIVAGPGVKKGRVCDQPVSLIDIYPTFIDICGMKDEPNSNTNHQPLDGYTVRPLFSDPTGAGWKGPDAALSAVASLDRLKLGEPGKVERQHYSLRTKKYRYILCNDGEEELYNHDSDPYEWKNLASDPGYADVKAELKGKLLKIIGSSSE
jgi:arylsulfatase A-like enzyme